MADSKRDLAVAAAGERIRITDKAELRRRLQAILPKDVFEPTSKRICDLVADRSMDAHAIQAACQSALMMRSLPGPPKERMTRQDATPRLTRELFLSFYGGGTEQELGRKAWAGLQLMADRDEAAFLARHPARRSDEPAASIHGGTAPSNSIVRGGEAAGIHTGRAAGGARPAQVKAPQQQQQPQQQHHRPSRPSKPDRSPRHLKKD